MADRRSKPTALFLNLGKVNATRVRRKPTQLVGRTISTTKKGRVCLQRVVYPGQSPTVITEGSTPSHSSNSTTIPGTSTVEDQTTTEDFGSFEETGLADDTEVVRSAHRLRQETLAEKWEELRDKLFKTGTSTSSLPPEAVCYVCHEDATIRCHDCAPDTFYCESCGMGMHGDVNLYHYPERWTGEVFVPFRFAKKLRRRQHHASCLTTYCKLVVVADYRGIQHHLMVSFCACEHEAVTLLRMKLWPATPQQPSLAFQFELLDSYESLLLECQVALRDFVTSLEVNLPWYEKLQKDTYRKLYPTIIDAFEEYRHFKYRIRHLTDLCPSLDDGTQCPACPTEEGVLFESVDALFGLPRKKSAGVSVRGPLHGDRMFYKQKDVDQFIASQSSSSVQGCNSFLAGHPTRSSTRYRALDETAVFGRACRHGFPKKFLNLKHGERIAYGTWILKSLQEEVGQKRIEVKLLYDIACVLFKHVQSTSQAHLLQNVSLAIPVFHAYGHQVSCQVQYNPRFKSGFGMTDGEVMERLWACLRRYGRMTKEMRPSHRTDVLTDVFLYVGSKAAARLCTYLPRKLKEARTIQQITSRDLESVLAEFPDLQQEQISMTELFLREIPDCGLDAIEPLWKKEYFDVIKVYNLVKAKIEPCCTSANAQTIFTLVQQLKSLDNRLLTMEREHDISQRWTDSTPDFQAIQVIARTNEHKTALGSIKEKASEFFYLSSIRRRFIEGQSISTSTNKTLQSCSRQLDRLVKAFNEKEWIRPPHHLELKDVRDPTSTFWTTFQQGMGQAGIPRTVEVKVAETLARHQRALEEEEILKLEMLNVLQYISNQVDALQSCLSTAPSSLQSTFHVNMYQVMHFAEKCNRAFLPLLGQVEDMAAPVDTNILDQLRISVEELNRTPQDTTAASRQTDPEYLSDSDNDTESLATDDFLCTDHSVNGDSCSDGENEDFAMLEDQTCLNRTVPSPSAAMAPSPSTVTAPSPSAMTAPSPLAVMATSPPGLSGPNSGADDDSCSDHDVDSDEEKVENALMRIAREQFVRANHDPVDTELQNTLDELIVAPTVPPPRPPTSRGSFLSIPTARLQRSLQQVRRSERCPRAYFLPLAKKDKRSL